jgi:hypothetical protein
MSAQTNFRAQDMLGAPQPKTAPKAVKKTAAPKPPVEKAPEVEMQVELEESPVQETSTEE